MIISRNSYIQRICIYIHVLLIPKQAIPTERVRLILKRDLKLVYSDADLKLTIAINMAQNIMNKFLKLAS